MWLAMIAIAAMVVWTALNRRDRSRITTFLLFLALCLALLTIVNPELRILLLFIDAVGVDVFLLLVLFQLQVGFAFVRRVWVEDLRHRLWRWGPALFHWRTVTNCIVVLLVASVLLHHLSR